MKWLVAICAVSVVIGLLLRDPSPAHRPFPDWARRMGAWNAKCAKYYGDTWAEPQKKACDLEKAGLDAEGRRNGWVTGSNVTVIQTPFAR